MARVRQIRREAVPGIHASRGIHAYICTITIAYERIYKIQAYPYANYYQQRQYRQVRKHYSPTRGLD